MRTWPCIPPASKSEIRGIEVPSCSIKSLDYSSKSNGMSWVLKLMTQGNEADARLEKLALHKRSLHSFPADILATWMGKSKCCWSIKARVWLNVTRLRLDIRANPTFPATTPGPRGLPVFTPILLRYHLLCQYLNECGFMTTRTYRSALFGLLPVGNVENKLVRMNTIFKLGSPEMLD